MGNGLRFGALTALSIIVVVGVEQRWLILDNQPDIHHCR
jgi:hypothetical protein